MVKYEVSVEGLSKAKSNIKLGGFSFEDFISNITIPGFPHVGVKD